MHGENIRSITRVLKLSIFFLLLFCSENFGQRFLQIERHNQPETKKFFEGDKITVKSELLGDDWTSIRIERIYAEESLIEHTQGYLKLDQISHIRIHKALPKYLAIALSQFGIVWLSYGGTAALIADFDFGWDTFLIGSVSVAAGYLINKFAAKRDLKLGDKNWLRTLDIRFPSADELAPGLR